MVNNPKKEKKYIRILKRLKRKLLARHVKLLRAVLISLVILLILCIGVLMRYALQRSGVGRYLNLGLVFLTTPREQILMQDNHTNILILGKAGEGHAAPELTDTIILASVDHSKNKESIKLLSLPRDIWITDLRAKLNSVYYWGKKKQAGGGTVLAKSVVEEITGVPIHYVVIIDFSGFVEIIDDVGGVDVNVDKSFVDEKYPIAGKEDDLCDGDPEYLCRYETIKFEAGIQHMDGTTALKFVRSRQSEDLEEGTDFARSKRQQLVISALKNKILSREVLFSYSKLKSLRENYNKVVQTDLTEPAMAILARRGLQARNNITPHTIPEDLLENPPLSPQYDNLYVFIPKSGDWEEVKSWVRDIFAQPAAPGQGST
jgi:LCP family protein required for cell wall assembly